VLRRRDLTEIDVSGPSTPVPLDGSRPDLLLLNDGDLAFVKVRFDERSAETLIRNVHTVDDELSRAVCWAALWDSCRDAELPATAYVDAVLAGAAVESDPEQTATLLEQAVTAATRYVPEPERPALIAALADAWWSAAAAADPGGDLQLVYVRAFVRIASDDRIDGLLAGSAPEGLKVDTELRWRVLNRLAALGRVSAAELDEELRDRDPTAAGERQHASCAAALPHQAAKQAAFTTLTEREDLGNDLARAIAGGFWQRGQEDLCRPWAQRYFDALPAVWASRSPAIAQQVTRLLYPALDEVATLELTDAFLEKPDLPAGCRRLVLEQRDDVARAIRAATAT
jgi:aminopeptidase N